MLLRPISYFAEKISKITHKFRVPVIFLGAEKSLLLNGILSRFYESLLRNWSVIKFPLADSFENKMAFNFEIFKFHP